jgi:hypothetical protein
LSIRFKKLGGGGGVPWGPTGKKFLDKGKKKFGKKFLKKYVEICVLIGW